MAKQFLKKYGYDISLDEGVGAYLVTWVTGLMVFFVTLALTVNFGLTSITKTWVTGLSGSLTVEIKPPIAPDDGSRAAQQEKKRFTDSVDEVIEMLKQNPAVAEARLLSDDEIKTLIQPWLGQGMSLDTLPLPALIDIKLAPKADIEQLQSRLTNLAPSATIDSHTDTLDDVKALVKTATMFVFLLTGVIILLAIVAISGIVRSKLLIHQSEVETLHLIGASDEYIARQFRQHTLKGTLKGAILGIICTFITLFAISFISHRAEGNILSHLELGALQWLILIIAPILIGAMIAHLTAQATVLKELSKLP